MSLDWILKVVLNFTCGEKIVLGYPLGNILYVSPDNKMFYDLTSFNMEKAIDDGSYDRLFNQPRMIKVAIKYANFPARKIIHIKNPLIDMNILASDPKYWISLLTLSLPRLQ